MYREKVASSRLEKIHTAIDDRFPEHLEGCKAFLRQKSVSATGERIRETAELIGRSIDKVGGKVTFWGNPSFPIVYGRLDKGCPKTLIIYGMYDVQPAEEPSWVSPPFAAETHDLPGIGECIIARGAVNSKGALWGLFNVLETKLAVLSSRISSSIIGNSSEEMGLSTLIFLKIRGVKSPCTSVSRELCTWTSFAVEADGVDPRKPPSMDLSAPGYHRRYGD